jgi:alkylated DNA nucleotide flippase Atl1
MAAAYMQVCKQVPSGKVSTYGELAKVLGSSPRAVGQVRVVQVFETLCVCWLLLCCWQCQSSLAASTSCTACTAQGLDPLS